MFVLFGQCFLLGESFNRVDSFDDVSSLVHSSCSAVEQVPAGALLYVLLLTMSEVFENRVQYYLKEASKHIWDDISHTRVVQSYVRICIHFNEPDAKILIDHEVKAKELEAIAPFGWIHRLLGTEIAIKSQILHSAQEVSVEVEAVLAKFIVEVLLKLFEAQDVAFFMFSKVLFIFHLKTVVG